MQLRRTYTSKPITYNQRQHHSGVKVTIESLHLVNSAVLGCLLTISRTNKRFFPSAEPARPRYTAAVQYGRSCYFVGSETARSRESNIESHTVETKDFGRQTLLYVTKYSP